MKNTLKIMLEIFEHVALFIVAYFGIKYTFVAGPIFFGPTAGIVVAIIVTLLFIVHIIKREVKRNESHSIKGLK